MMGVATCYVQGVEEQEHESGIKESHRSTHADDR